MSPCSADLQLCRPRVKEALRWDVHYSAPPWGCSEKPFSLCHTNTSKDTYAPKLSEEKESLAEGLPFYRASNGPNEKTFSVASLHTAECVLLVFPF